MARAAVEEVEDQAPRQRLRLIRQLGPKRLRSIALPICGESFKLFTSLRVATLDREIIQVPSALLELFSIRGR